MRTNWYKKGWVVGIIILFIGAGIQPAFAEESIITTLDNEEDCNDCQVVDSYSSLRVKLLLFKATVVTNIISSSRLGDIPEIKEECQELSNKISKMKNELGTELPIQDYPLICDSLSSSIITIEYIFAYLDVLSQLYPNIKILQTLYILFANIYDILNAVIFILMEIFDCW